MLKKIFYTGFFAWIFLYILVYLKPELHYHAQQPAFMDTWYFFSLHLLYPGDISKYISDFLMQGFYFNWLGSLIILFLAASLSFLLHGILQKSGIKNSLLLMIVPFVFAIVLFNDYYFPMKVLINVVLVFLAVYLLSHFLHFRSFLVPYLLSAYISLYFLSGSGTALVFSISGLLVLFFKLPLKDFLFKGGIFLALAVILPFISYTILFNLTLAQAYFHFLPEVPVTQLYNKSFLVYLFLFVLPVIICIAFIFKKIQSSNVSIIAKTRSFFPKESSSIWNLILYILIIGFTFSLMSFEKNSRKRDIVLSDYHCYHGNWDNVIDMALADNEYDISINIDYNRALDYSGKFLQNFFDYPQLIGTPSLFPDKIGSPVYSMKASDCYLDISYVSESQHWAYALLTIEPYNQRVLRRLVVTNMILGNYKASQTYLNVLSHYPWTSEFIEKYLPLVNDTARVANDPYILKKRALQPTSFAIPVNGTDRISEIVARDSTNRQAFEHLQVCHLMEHELGKFMSRFDNSVAFYNQIPAIYEQALLLFLYSADKASSNIKISEVSMKQFQSFLNTMKQCNNNKELARNYLDGMKNTYIYYVTYLSPRVTGLKAETQKQ